MDAVPTELAFWECLYTPGHDAACMTRHGEDGWLLHGTAVFRHPAGPARIDYAVDIDAAWRSRRGTVRGYLAGRRLDHRIERRDDGWYLDGRPQGLSTLPDLDFGFTPATNLQQLRRAALQPGQAIDMAVAWFDLGATNLTALPQHYERLDAARYRYVSPDTPYEAVLELAPNGFARLYPGLWRMVD